MKITAQDLEALGVIDTVVKEPVGGAHRDRPMMMKRVGDAMPSTWPSSTERARPKSAVSARIGSWRSAARFKSRFVLQAVVNACFSRLIGAAFHGPIGSGKWRRCAKLSNAIQFVREVLSFTNGWVIRPRRPIRVGLLKSQGWFGAVLAAAALVLAGCGSAPELIPAEQPCRKKRSTSSAKRACSPACRFSFASSRKSRNSKYWKAREDGPSTTSKPIRSAIGPASEPQNQEGRQAGTRRFSMRSGRSR